MKLTDNVTGIQHIGIPTKDVDATIAFFESLGFEVTWSVKNEIRHVAFLKLKDLVIETFRNAAPAGIPGAIEHVALNVQDIEAAWDAVKALGYEPLAPIKELPFLANGVRFFMIVGPNGEKVEFNQML